MKVLDQYVLVRQVMIKKQSKIIKINSTSEDEKWDFSFEIVQVGPNCQRDIKQGDIPIFGKHVQFNGGKILENTEERKETLVIVHEGDIIAIDNPEETKQEI